jgi:hypothetical protein
MLFFGLGLTACADSKAKEKVEEEKRLANGYISLDIPKNAGVDSGDPLGLFSQKIYYKPLTTKKFNSNDVENIELYVSHLPSKPYMEIALIKAKNQRELIEIVAIIGADAVITEAAMEDDHSFLSYCKSNEGIAIKFLSAKNNTSTEKVIHTKSIVEIVKNTVENIKDIEDIKYIKFSVKDIERTVGCIECMMFLCLILIVICAYFCIRTYKNSEKMYGKDNSNKKRSKF